MAFCIRPRLKPVLARVETNILRCSCQSWSLEKMMPNLWATSNGSSHGNVPVCSTFYVCTVKVMILLGQRQVYHNETHHTRGDFRTGLAEVPGAAWAQRKNTLVVKPNIFAGIFVCASMFLFGRKLNAKLGDGIRLSLSLSPNVPGSDALPVNRDSPKPDFFELVPSLHMIFTFFTYLRSQMRSDSQSYDLCTHTCTCSFVWFTQLLY